MLLSVQGPGMAAGASAVWVRDAGCSHPPPPSLGLARGPWHVPTLGTGETFPRAWPCP